MVNAVLPGKYLEKPTKDLFVKKVHSPWQEDALGVCNSFDTR